MSTGEPWTRLDLIHLLEVHERKENAGREYAAWAVVCAQVCAPVTLNADARDRYFTLRDLMLCLVIDAYDKLPF